MTDQETLAQIAAAVENDLAFSTNAELALRVRKLLDDPDCSVDQLSKLISAEPVLLSRVLGVANTVAYNPSGRATSDIHTAVSRLGFNTLRILATAVIVRQMQNLSRAPEHRALAGQLWEHTAQVAALARVIARRITRQDPDAAFFAGIVHEVGAFYLITQAAEHPELLAGDLAAWHESGEAQVGQAVLHRLGVPENIMAAQEVLWNGYLSMPPQSLGDTLLLADQLSPLLSPLSGMTPAPKAPSADLDLLIDDELLSGILAESAAEVQSLSDALKA